jgi:hypothetical protein
MSQHDDEKADQDSKKSLEPAANSADSFAAS